MADIRRHASRDYPREACGLVTVRNGRLRYVACRNVAEDAAQFRMHPEDAVSAEDAGAVVLVVHSHPDMPAKPSPADLEECDRSGLPWLIVSWPSGEVCTVEPKTPLWPLEGRQFEFGVRDCYTLVRDYYAQRLGIALPDFVRDEASWRGGHSFYLQGYTEAGFVVVEGPQAHDVLLLHQVSHHGAVYLGDGLMLHHQIGRLSSRDVYSGWHRSITTHVLRHRSLME